MVRCQTKETPLEIIRQMHNHREVGLQGQKRNEAIWLGSSKTKGFFSAMGPSETRPNKRVGIIEQWAKKLGGGGVEETDWSST